MNIENVMFHTTDTRKKLALFEVLKSKGYVICGGLSNSPGAYHYLHVRSGSSKLVGNHCHLFHVRHREVVEL